jgi:hypothetical protein
MIDKSELIDALNEALNGLTVGWMLGNVADPTERARLQASIIAATDAIVAMLDKLDPIKKDA